MHVRLEEGELAVRSGHLASGYFRNPEATAEAFRDGWFYTGELAEQDDEGFLYIVGRTKEMIRTGGEWVAPVEVDAVLLRVILRFSMSLSPASPTSIGVKWSRRSSSCGRDRQWPWTTCGNSARES